MPYRDMIFEQTEVVLAKDLAVPVYVLHQWRRTRLALFAALMDYYGEGLPYAMCHVTGWQERTKDVGGNLVITITVRVEAREGPGLDQGDPDDPHRRHRHPGPREI